jgi:microcin C transport system substrate-binding protein
MREIGRALMIGRASMLVSLLAAGVVLAGAAVPALAQSEAAPQQRHALSLLGEPKYKPGFKSFDYVNPAAPKGGRARLPAIGAFDSLNPVLYRGLAGAGLGLINDSLMDYSLDEPSTAYCTICEWVSYPADFSSVTFELRAAARFHDGKPITTDDVVFSFESAKAANPRVALYYKNVTKAEPQGPRRITFHFDVKGNRELPQIMGELTVFPKHWWTGKDKDGNQRDIMKTTLEPPLGSGPYRLKEVVPGRSIAYERVPDYWAKELPNLVGQHNFDEVRFEYFKDSTPAFEAFKVGQIDFYVESSAKSWATQYDFAALSDGLVRKREISLRRVNGMQAFVFNLRRDKYKDPRVRQAFNLAFDFEWAATNLFYGQYKRLGSYFENSELASRGLPQGLELEILNSVKDKVPAEVFTTEYKNPVAGSTEASRTNLRAASKLLADAGWVNKGGVLTNAQGQTLTVEFLLDQPNFERIVTPFVQSLDRLGVKASIRQVDTPQYKRRTDSFDYDSIVASFAQSESPGNEQRDYWGSAAADRQGSRNLIGLKNAGVDALIDRIILAKDRNELVAATRALDRVLLWSHLVVPHWYVGHERAAHWELFGEPKTLPSRSDGFPTAWWWDEAKAKATLAKR